MKKKILLVVRWPVGGIRTFLRYVYRNFDTSRWQITIIAPALTEMNVLIDDLSTIDARYIPIAKDLKLFSFSFKIFVELMRGCYDLVHSHGFTSGICTALPAKLSRTRHLMTSHDVINTNQFLDFKGRIKKKILNALFNVIDKIHSVSQDAQNNFIENFSTLSNVDEKCIVISNGIEITRFLNATPRDLRAELGLSENTFLIGFLGRFMSQKGFKYLIDAVGILHNDSSLSKKPIILIFSDGGFIREEKQIIKNKSLDKYFLFMPFTSNVASTLKGLDVVTMPSLWEACPLLAMETLVCGTPFIGTNCIGLREVLKDTPAIIVPKEDAMSLAMALSQEMTSSSKKDFMNFRDVASKKFDVQNTSGSLRQLYEKMGLK